jgi:hypothetical protein
MTIPPSSEIDALDEMSLLRTGFPTEPPNMIRREGETQIVWLTKKPEPNERIRTLARIPRLTGFYLTDTSPLEFIQHQYGLCDWVMTENHVDSVNYDAEANVVTIRFHRIHFMLAVWRNA